MINQRVSKQIKASPQLPGIYLFKKNNNIIYIGKAASLNNRLHSYLNLRVAKNRNIQKEANNLKIIITNNEIEALLLEAKLIKKHQPKHNSIFKDEKNYFFVKFSNELLPKISIVHQEKIVDGKTIGPFTSGSSLKELLKMIRWSFPFCTCKNNHKKDCLSSQLGLCQGYCCSLAKELSKDQIKEYQGNIKKIEKILTCHNRPLIKSLKKEIETAIKQSNFEKADLIKKQISSIENIFKHQPSLKEKENWNYDKINKIFKDFFETKKNFLSIEMYDISNISGKYATASLVFFKDGLPEKKQYKKFKIKNTPLEPNDIKMLKEVFSRRVDNPHWEKPDLILVDGGKAQLNAAIKIFKQHQEFKDIFLGSLAKGKSQLFILKIRDTKCYNLKDLPVFFQNFLKAIQDESHRFAIGYHHQLYLKSIKKKRP